MITPEEIVKFEKLFEELKYLILSEKEDKFDDALIIINKLVYLKNEGNQHKTAKELGISTKTVRNYLKDYSSREDMLNMHLNMLATNKWFAELPIVDQQENINLVNEYYTVAGCLGASGPDDSGLRS